MPAKGHRQAKSKVFPFQQNRLGKFYEHKRVDVIYVAEQETLITITVYVFYGEWKD